MDKGEEEKINAYQRMLDEYDKKYPEISSVAIANHTADPSFITDNPIEAAKADRWVQENAPSLFVYDEHGKLSGTSWPIRISPSGPDFTFRELYEAMVEYLEAVILMLEQLKALPRFA